MILIITILLILVGVSIIAYWVVYILQDRLPLGIRTLESGGYITFHILAEIITAVLCILGGVALVLNSKSGHLIALLGSGMLL